MPTKLALHADTIDTAKIKTITKTRTVIDSETGEQKEITEQYLRLAWSINLGSKTVRKQTTVRKTKSTTHGTVRARAHAQARQLIECRSDKWTQQMKLADYVNKVSHEKVLSAPLRPRSQQRYLQSLNQVLEALPSATIEDALSRRTPETVYKYVLEHHGTESARKAILVLGKYIYRQMRLDEITNRDPIQESEFSIPTQTTQHEVKYLTRDEYNRVLNHLMFRNILQPLPPGTDNRRSSWVLHQRAVDLTLFQMATGFRLSEVLALQWNDLWIADGKLIAPVYSDVAKNHKQRAVAFLSPQIEKYFLAKMKNADLDTFIISAPTDPANPWRADNAGAAIKRLTNDLAQILDIPVLAEKGVRSHIWRATLNILTSTTVPLALREKFFGHTGAINARHYTSLASDDVATSMSRLL